MAGMHAASDTTEDRQADLLTSTGPRSSAAPGLHERQRRNGTRDRVTVDLRGLGPRLRSCAQAQRTTPAALMRKAVMRVLGDIPEDSRSGLGPEAAREVVKVTLRISRARAALLAGRALSADVAQGDYVCGLLDGLPPPPHCSDHAAAVTALMASTDRLAALSSDLNALLRLLGQVRAVELESYRAGVGSLLGDVREHLALASALMAEHQPARRFRR